MADTPSKYDTDPLDPDFEQRTTELQGATRPVSGDAARMTVEQARRVETAEDPTRRFDENDTTYRSVFATQHEIRNAPRNPSPDYATPFNSSPAQTTPFDPRAYAPPTAPAYMPPTVNGAQFNSPTRKIDKIGLPENLAAMLPYTPFYIGIVVSLLELVLVPRREVRTRFHAAQGLALQLAIFVVSFLFRIIGFTTGYRIGGILFSIAAFVFLIVSMIRVYQGNPHSITPLADLTKWINEKIESRGKYE
ncbi:MAG: hypothetical protein NVSMB56_10320 [Pyrinomonadaceae bacterium]